MVCTASRRKLAGTLVAVHPRMMNAIHLWAPALAFQRMGPNDEPMTGPQAVYLKKLADLLGIRFERRLTRREAERRIDELQFEATRGITDGICG